MLFAEKKNNEAKRKNRIQQVREQSKTLASNIRKRVTALEVARSAASNITTLKPNKVHKKQYFPELPPVGINDFTSPRQAKLIRDEEWKVNKEFQMNRSPSKNSKPFKAKARPTIIVSNSRRKCTQSSEKVKKLTAEGENIDKFYSEKDVDAENECSAKNEDTIIVPAVALNLSPSIPFAATSSKPTITVSDLKHRTLDPTLYRIVPLETLRQMNNANDDSAKPDDAFTERDDEFAGRNDKSQPLLRKNLHVNFTPENVIDRPCDSAIFNNVSNYIKNRPIADRNFQTNYDDRNPNLENNLDSIRHTLIQARQSSVVPPEVPKLPVHYPQINSFTSELPNDVAHDKVKYERSSVIKSKKVIPSKNLNQPQKSVTYLTRKVCSCKPSKKQKAEGKQTMQNCKAPKSSTCQFPANRDRSINTSYVKKLLKDGIDAYKSALDVTSNIETPNTNFATKKINRDKSPKKLVNMSQNTSPKKNKHQSPVKKLEKSVQVDSPVHKDDHKKSENFAACKKSPCQKVYIEPEKETSESVTSSSNEEKKSSSIVSSSDKEKDIVKYSEKFDFNALFNHIEKQKEKILNEVQKITVPTPHDEKIVKPISPQKNSKALSLKPGMKTTVKNKPSSKISGAVSFEDLQIIIEVKKANKKVEKNVTNDKGEIIESVSQTDSSNEYSIRASKITSKKKIFVDNKENIHVDTSESTSYWSPPEKINLLKHFEGPRASSSENNFTKKNINTKPMQSNTRNSLVPNVKNIDEKFNIDTNLKIYIEKLLNMPKENIESLKVNTSEISTPGCSVVDVSSNKSNGYEKKLNEKLLKIKEFIRNNYILLEELQSDNFITSDSSKKCTNSSDTSVSQAAMKNVTWKRELSKNVTPQTSTSTSKDNIPQTKRVKEKIRKKKTRAEKREIKNSDDHSSHSVPSEDFGRNKNKPNIASNVKPVEILLPESNKPSEIFEETFDKLSEQCVKKISDLNDQLDKVRKDKQLTLSNGSNSSGETESNKNVLKSEDHHDNAFTPILLDIPKPTSFNQKDDDKDRIDVPPKESHEFIPMFPPSVITELKNKNIQSDFPHELSTIIEVDTPITLKNTFKDTSSAVDSIVESNKISDNPPADKVEKENLTSVSDNWKEQVDMSLKPFVSFKEFVKTTDGSSPSSSVLEESTSNETLPDIIPEMLKRNLIDKPYFETTDNLTSLDALLKKDLISPSKKTKKSSPTKNPSKNTKDIDQSIIDFENVLKSIGMEWAVSTFRKTGEAMDLSSSSSSVNIDFNDPKKHSKSDDAGTTFSNLNLSTTSCGMSTLIDDWNISANLLKEYSLGNISKTSFDKYLEAFLKKINEQEKMLEKDKPQEDIGLKDQKPTNISQDTSKKIQEKSQTDEKTSTLQGSKDKTQHQTSTPVKLAKSLSSSDSRLGGDYLFSMEDELSSVKNTSHTEKNSSSDDNKTLSVPNISLKFGKLFDSNNR